MTMNISEYLASILTYLSIISDKLDPVQTVVNKDPSVLVTDNPSDEKDKNGS